MAYAFSPSERWAVFTAHGSQRGTKCWLCRKPLNFVEMAVDHVLPEHMQDHPKKLARVLQDFGLPADFNLNSFENWLLAHGPCNVQKLKHVFRPTPLIQRYLDRARKKADEARRIRDEAASRRKIDRAIGTLSAGETALPPELLDAVAQHYAAANSASEVVAEKMVVPRDGKIGFAYKEQVFEYTPPKEMQLAPNLTIIFNETPQQEPDGPFVYRVEEPKRRSRKAR